MNISKFFIDRPVFAGVLSILIFVAGLLALGVLPISEYPEVVPPQVVVRATYPGASPKVIEETVATPIEEQISGVENMLYMYSQATTDGLMTLTITFKLGTDPDQAEQWVQNRVSQAEPRLPDAVRALGITTIKSSPDLMMVVHLVSPDNRFDAAYLRNYALLHVKDRLSAIDGVGEVQLQGSGDYAMRVWLDPQKMAEHRLSTSDVTGAIRAQNVQAAAGVVGSSPNVPGVATQLSINAQGRLQTPEEFGDIVVKTGTDGQVTRLRDVARLELGASDYSLRSLLSNKTAAAAVIFQAPGSNAIQIADNVRRVMEEVKKNMPEGVTYEIAYDTTQFVRASIDAVVHTLLDAIVLVVIVVVLFLQTWRASIIPLVAVPVSIVGTFAVMHLLGFSINALSLFGLVLAIGIVVDDAIVVVENVERNIEQGLSPLHAAHRAMEEVSGPIVAIALVLVAVFVPLAFISGLTGQFYRQFALTIAISTVISAINSLTLSPALAALLLRGHHAPKDLLTRVLDGALGWLFRGFNRIFFAGADAYSGGVKRVISRKSMMMAVYLGLVGLAVVLFRVVPGGFVPLQDKQYLVSFAQLPDGASLDRTDAVIRRMTDIALKTPGADYTVAFPGLSINGFTNSSNAGIVFVGEAPFEKRTTPNLSGNAIAATLNGSYASIQDAYIAVFPPPPVQGLGTIGGFKLEIEDRASLGYEALDQATKAFLAEAAKAPELGHLFTGYQVNVPQLYADIDRTRAQQLGVSVTDVFDTLQTYLGSLYVNDFNVFGRTYSVRVQADAKFRAHTRRHWSAESTLCIRRHGATRRRAARETQRRPGARHALQRLSLCRHQWRRSPWLLHRSGTSRHRPRRSRCPAARLRLRMDRPDLSANSRRQLRHPRLSAGTLACLPGARSTIRKPHPPVGHHSDRAHGPARCHDRRLAHPRGQQRVHANRPYRARRPLRQERHPHRGIRPRTGIRRTHATRSRHRSQPSTPASDPHDIDGFHHGRRAAGDLHRRRSRNAQRHGYRGFLRHDRRDSFRIVPDACVLRRATAPGG